MMFDYFEDLKLEDFQMTEPQKELFHKIKSICNEKTEYLVFRINNRGDKPIITQKELIRGVKKGLKEYIHGFYKGLKKRFITDDLIGSMVQYIGIIEYGKNDTDKIHLHIHLFITPKENIIDVSELKNKMIDEISLNGRKKDGLLKRYFQKNVYDYVNQSFKPSLDGFIQYHTKTFKNGFLSENVIHSM